MTNPDRLKLVVEIIKQSGIYLTVQGPQVTDADDIIEKEIVTTDPLALKIFDNRVIDKEKAMRRIYDRLEGTAGVGSNKGTSIDRPKEDE